MNVVLSQLNFGPKKFFCDAIIKRVKKVEKAVQTIEDKFVELVMGPMCRQILKVCRLPTVLNMQKRSLQHFLIVQAREFLVKVE